MKRLEELAQMVLDMRAKQKEFDRLSKVSKYTKHIDAETIAELHYELKMAQKMVEEECMDILGIEEEE